MPAIRKPLGNDRVAYSATIGDPGVFSYESGIDFPFLSMPSDFPASNTRIYLPSNNLNLARDKQKRGDKARALRRIVKACGRFAESGMRSLVVVISEQERERERFLQMCSEEGVNAVSYGNGISGRQAAANFKTGEGDVLVGTAAQYGEGIDLPRQIAPVIFFLRPGYPHPDDPMSQFEERRFGASRWKLWNWRVMVQALQVRGRNIRAADGKGVTFFYSAQFRRFVYSALPEWLEPSYRGDMTFEQCLEDAESLLSKKR